MHKIFPAHFHAKNIDDQRHILRCAPVLAKLTPKQQAIIHTVNYEDIFDSLDKQSSAVTEFSWLLDARAELFEAVSPASGGSLDASPSGDGMGLGD